MGTKKYDIEPEHSKLVGDLKALPKINAPENFEFNLMARIQNKNFGETKNEKPQFSIIKFLAPSAVVVTALIVFFIFIQPNNNPSDNPLMSAPAEITSGSQAAVPAQNKLTAEKPVVKNKSTDNKVGIAESNNSAPKLDKVIQPNNAVGKSKLKYPINRNRSIALDDFISGDTEQASTMRRGNVVTSDQQTGADFDGFLIRQKPDKQLIEKYREMIDSAKNAQMKADSVKKAQKMK